MKKNAPELIDEIGQLVRDVWKYSENPELLSKCLNDIAVLNWALAVWRTEFDELERVMKTELDVDKANSNLKYADRGEAVNKAEIRTTIELAPKRLEYNKMASNADKVKIIMQATDKVMDAARSRLALIRQEVAR